MVDTISFGCFPIMTEIAGFFPGRRKQMTGWCFMIPLCIIWTFLCLFSLGTAVTSTSTPQCKASTSLEQCALLLPSIWCRASCYIPIHDAFTAVQKSLPKQFVLQLHSFFPLCRKLSSIWGHWAFSIMLPLHFHFPLRTITVSLFFSYSSCLLDLE